MTDVSGWPSIHVIASVFCNLKCPYCPKSEYWPGELTDDFLLSDEFLGKVRTLSNVHFILSGGEVLLNIKGVKNLIKLAAENGHALTFYTNLSVPHEMLVDILDNAPIEVLNNFHITHHLHANVDEENFIKNVLHLQGLGIPCEVKYLAAPEDLDAVIKYFEFWESRGIHAIVSVLQGKWRGRTFPDDYTEAELRIIIPLTGSISRAMQFFGALDSKGLSCRAGSMYFSWNTRGKGEKILCCNDSSDDGDSVKWDATCFATGIEKSIPCALPFCGTFTEIDSARNIFKEFKKSLIPGTGRHPTIPEAVAVARKIETETGRTFTAWPKFLAEMSRELGLGVGGELFIPANLKETVVLSLPSGKLLPSLEMRSFGGSASMTVEDGCVMLKTVSADDSIRTPFFTLPPTNTERRVLSIAFDNVHCNLGDFSWRLVIQDHSLKTIKKIDLDPVRKGDGVSTIKKNIHFYTDNDLPLRLIFVPTGKVGGGGGPFAGGLSVSSFS